MEQIKSEIERIAKDELKRANEKFPLFHSKHEGFAVILEEIWESENEFKYIKHFSKELKWSVFCDYPEHEVKSAVKSLKNTAVKACAELVQVVAMCDKFIMSRDEMSE
jgi:hypothetical protein